MKTIIYFIILFFFSANVIAGSFYSQNSGNKIEQITEYESQAKDLPPTTSLVYPGVDGELVYIADSLGNRIPDFSNAGYKGGGVPIPYVQSKATIWPPNSVNRFSNFSAISRL